MTATPNHRLQTTFMHPAVFLPSWVMLGILFGLQEWLNLSQWGYHVGAFILFSAWGMEFLILGILCWLFWRFLHRFILEANVIDMLTRVLPLGVGFSVIQELIWVLFFPNLPLAVIVVVLCAFVPEVRDEDAKGRLDWAGAACTIIGLAGLTYSLIEWPSTHRPVALTLIAVGGLIALAALSFIEQRAESPMIPFGLFGSRNFTGANLLTFLVYAPLGALLFFFPQDLIQIQHYSATKAGAAFSPFVLIMLVLSRWAGRLVERYGARLPLTIGPLIATVGYATFALIWSDLSTPAHSWCCF